MTFCKSFQISSFQKAQQASGFSSKFPFAWLRWKETPAISPSIPSESIRDCSQDSKGASSSPIQSNNEFYDGIPMDLPHLSFEDCYHTVLDVDVSGLQKSYLRLVTLIILILFLLTTVIEQLYSLPRSIEWHFGAPVLLVSPLRQMRTVMSPFPLRL
jgi:hypothetical protein